MKEVIPVVAPAPKCQNTRVYSAVCNTVLSDPLTALDHFASIQQLEAALSKSSKNY
jgi:hypothetical protein